MKVVLSFLLFLNILCLRSQPSEYILTELAGSNFNDIVLLDDKIVLATDLAFCHEAGVTFFDTVGIRSSLMGYNSYYSIAPSIAKTKDQGSYLLTFKNESEEFYDVNQMIIYQLDHHGVIIKTRVDTTYEFDYDGQILAVNDDVIVLCGSYIYQYSEELDLIDAFRITPEPHSPYDFDIVSVDSSQLTLLRSHVVYLANSRPLIADQIVVYQDLDFSTAQVYNLTYIQGISAYTDSAVYIYGADQYLRKFDLRLLTVTDSIFWADLR